MAQRVKTGGKQKGYKAPHTLEAQEAKKHVIARVIAELDPILDAQIEVAKQSTNRNTTNSFRELMERAFGKVPTTVGTEDDKPFIIQIAEAVARKNDPNYRAE